MNNNSKTSTRDMNETVTFITDAVASFSILESEGQGFVGGAIDAVQEQSLAPALRQQPICRSQRHDQQSQCQCPAQESYHLLSTNYYHYNINCSTN